MGIGNEPLRRAMLRAGLDTPSLAEATEVSAKSVERWLTGTSVPYPKTRYGSPRCSARTRATCGRR